MPRFKGYPADYSQSQLFLGNVFDLLPDDHDCFVYRDLFEQLDTSEVDALYSRRGQRTYAPLQIPILITRTATGVQFPPDRAALQRGSGIHVHRGQALPELPGAERLPQGPGRFFRSCFGQTVRMALELDMASLGQREPGRLEVQASSSKHKAMSYGRMRERERALCEEIESLSERARRCDEEEERSDYAPFLVNNCITRRLGPTSLGRERVVGATDLSRYASAGAECRQVPCSRTTS